MEVFGGGRERDVREATLITPSLPSLPEHWERPRLGYAEDPRPVWNRVGPFGIKVGLAPQVEDALWIIRTHAIGCNGTTPKGLLGRCLYCGRFAGRNVRITHTKTCLVTGTERALQKQEREVTTFLRETARRAR